MIEPGQKFEDMDNIKALVPVVCPNCKETMVIELVTEANLLDEDDARKVLGKKEVDESEEI